ncbi:HAMP domain-containing histidine kinase [Rhizobium sp. P38BS-XIX]|uniref:sensor histidine kinase n=1 Tax=Rhizobium sp. P38BS-XIX TaxID=2726740 RepID=UPI0014568AE0|nr:HAMP domain-containing sensor histidine kinase [Rhizobium sp. P38BS-XIX]NLR98064.1 HAMP domain-containing histidine kinase [Rhizobium sp. P38BS-XIX]
MTIRRFFKASIAGRLVIFSAVFAGATISIAALVLWFIVTSIVREQIDQRLDVQIEGIRNALTADTSGKVAIKTSLDGPPFDRLGSGWYWQVTGKGLDLSSRSLVGTNLEMTPPRFEWTSLLLERSQPTEGTDNQGTRLHVRVVNALVDNQAVRILVTAPTSAIFVPALKALAWLIATMIALGLALMIGGFLQVRFGLKPLRALTSELSAISGGQAARLSAVDVVELAPIGDEINRLIEMNDVRLHDTRIHFANLAHSLKTPVASLQLALNDQNDTTGELRDLVKRVELRIRHHLARARSTTSAVGQTQTVSIGPRIEDILNMMRRLYADRRLSATLKIMSETVVACSAEDFDEIVGNIVDNAFKWARTSISISVTSDRDRAAITVADDGAGLSDSEIARAMAPGVRIDETVPGHGFGLSIAKELSELYGGSISIPSGQDSGLVVVIGLPLGKA